MAVSLLFKGTDDSETNETCLELNATEKKELHVSIKGDAIQHVYLTKIDAIKLSKELKKQINLISLYEKKGL